jgi:hypothetical protein
LLAHGAPFLFSREPMTKVISPSGAPLVVAFHNLAPSSSGKQRLFLARTSQSAGVPKSRPQRIISTISASRSATYTSRVSGMSAAISATR